MAVDVHVYWDIERHKLNVANNIFLGIPESLEILGEVFFASNIIITSSKALFYV